MGRRRQSAELFVSMNGERVGTLLRSSSGSLEFSYDKTWLLSEHCRPLSLSMPLSKNTLSGDRVENFFDNLLPDSLSVRNRIQARFSASSGGSYRLTPVYDVMSAYPFIVRNQTSHHKLKMAMALMGKRKCYDWNYIFYQHWLSTAKLSRFSPEEMETMIHETLDRMDDVLDEVAAQLPTDFPEAVALPIFDGMRKSRDRLIRSSTL